jgi:2-succinyl-5-enolpyruvyl-6-hydroxy-3-cyclohexene-1-carboxylate synthase
MTNDQRLDFRNVNTLWASLLAETLNRLGLNTAIVCPGSRSAPLAIAFAQHPGIEAIPILDERSAAFFALGIAKQTGLPIALACTSGTAGANFYPAIIEARESRVPLLVLTADRPPELRHCHAGQAIDQVRLYGHYPNWQAELALPSADGGMLRYLRQVAVQAWERSLFPVAGPVHLNLPFREPLAPVVQPELASLAANFAEGSFFSAVSPPKLTVKQHYPLPTEWQTGKRGIIIGGVAQPQPPQQYCQAIATLSRILQYPVLAESLSPLRNYAALLPNLIATYDLILRQEKLAEILAPEIVIQLGELPTSKELRTWLERLQPQRWIVDPSPENFDPLHGKTVHLRVAVEDLITENPPANQMGDRVSDYYLKWSEVEGQVRQAIAQKMQAIDWLLEAKTSWLLSQILPANTPLFIANSMSVRNMEFFWMPNNLQVVPFFNRGANGIDGTLSTALGMAHRHQNSVLLTGDLALLHDINGFLINHQFQGHLTIVLVNNNGGGIFEMLPISQFDPPFEQFFATPQHLDFSKLCLAYGIEYHKITNWQQFEQLFQPMPSQGIRVLEIQTERKADALWLQENLSLFAGRGT